MSAVVHSSVKHSSTLVVCRTYARDGHNIVSQIGEHAYCWKVDEQSWLASTGSCTPSLLNEEEDIFAVQSGFYMPQPTPGPVWSLTEPCSRLPAWRCKANQGSSQKSSQTHGSYRMDHAQQRLQQSSVPSCSCSAGGIQTQGYGAPAQEKGSALEPLCWALSLSTC